MAPDDMEKITFLTIWGTCAMGLHVAIDKGVKNLKVYGDWALVIYQL